MLRVFLSSLFALGLVGSGAVALAETGPAALNAKPCPPGREPVIIGSNAKVGSGARARSKAVSTLTGLAGGLLGGGGGSGKNGPPLVRCKIKDKQMTVFTDPGTGISLKVGAKQAGDALFVFAEVDKSPDSGTFQTAFLETPDGAVRTPDKLDICSLWGEWSLTVSWTKTTYVDGQVVSRESGGYSRTGDFNIPGLVSSDQAPQGLWRQMGFSNASHGARMIGMRYKLPPGGLSQPLATVIHVTRPGQDPVISQPFALLMTQGPDGIVLNRQPPLVCPPAGPVMADGDGGPPAPGPFNAGDGAPATGSRGDPPPAGPLVATGGDIAPATSGGTTARPAQPPPTSPPLASQPGDIAVVSGQSVTSTGCPWPSGKLGVHFVDHEVYSPITYGTTETFTDLADIVRQLRAKVAPHYDPLGLCGKCIQQLDVWGHGDTGGGYISFGPNDAVIGKQSMGTDLDRNLAAVGALMCVGGKVVINQCKGGTGTKGTEALQQLADKIGVPVSGPTGEIKSCRIFGGLLTGYKEQAPGPGARTPVQNQAGPVGP